MIAAVRHGHRVVYDGNVLRTVERIQLTVNKSNEITMLVEDLNARVAPVDHDNVVARIARHSGRPVELALMRSVRAEAKLELAHKVKHLDAVVVKVGDDYVAARVRGAVLRPGKVLVLVAQVAEATQVLALRVEDAHGVRFRVRYNYLILVHFIYADSLWTLKIV
jgi:hypothetical protein